MAERQQRSDARVRPPLPEPLPVVGGGVVDDHTHLDHEASDEVVASLLLAATLKFDGSLVMQIHGDGPVALYVVDVDTAGSFRATVKVRDEAACPPDADLRALVDATGRGRFVVTLDPRHRDRATAPYQGIVPFEGEHVAGVLEQYMQRSEQVPTRLWLAADALPGPPRIPQPGRWKAPVRLPFQARAPPGVLDRYGMQQGRAGESTPA